MQKEAINLKEDGVGAYERIWKKRRGGGNIIIKTVKKENLKQHEFTLT